MKPKTVSSLHLALGISIAAHAVLLTIRFVDPERFNRVFQDTPLEVVLVNARSNERPDKAQAIAQAALAGGGDADKGRATSPLPYSALTAAGNAEQDAQRELETLQAQQMLMLAQVKQMLSAMPPADPREASTNPQAREKEDKRRQLLQLLAEIERRIELENARPRKRYVSPATREEAYAAYYDLLRRRIEDRGTSNFPEDAGRKLYGELTMMVTVNHDGQVLDTEVVQSSGSRQLDRRARGIARAAGPFGPFSPAMRARADQIVVVARFKFTRDETLETKLTSQ